MSDSTDNGVGPVEPESAEADTESTDTTEGTGETDAPQKPAPRPDHHTDPFHSTN